MERAVPTVEIPLELPDKKLVICQGFHGPFHRRMPTSIQLDYAVDFATPVGSIVLAARDGFVRELSMSSNHFSRDLDLAPDKVADYVAFVTNWISLDHDDGLQTVYAHLMSESQRVERGRRVHAGQILARTGLSGWMGDIENLHFHVQEWQRPAEHGGKGRTVTVPFLLNGYKGSLEHAEIYPPKS